MATAIPKACLASSAIRCRDVETGPHLGVLAVFPSNGATGRCPLRHGDSPFMMRSGSRGEFPHSNPGTVKLCVPPRQSRGVSHTD